MKDLTGIEYDGQIVLGFSHKDKGHYFWNVQCSCGNIRPVRAEQINKQKSKHCGCKTADNLIGLKFGRLEVKRRKGSNALWQTLWLCECECGKEIVVLGKSLKRGYTTSCGCYKTEKILEAKTTHGLSKTPIYSVYDGMISRCYNPKNKKYKNYGERGIRVCKDWLEDKSVFFSWAFSNGFEPGLQIDRINNNQDYSPENCRWVTSHVNNNNRNNNVFITHNNKTQTIEQWAEVLQIGGATIGQRLKRGCNTVDVLKTTHLVTGESLVKKEKRYGSI